MSIALSHTAAVILAAGRGSRMNAQKKNKVAFYLGGKPMIVHTVDNLLQAGVGQIIVVVGYQSESVKKALGTRVSYAVQKEQLGTGDALRSALSALSPEVTTVLSVYGDDSAFCPPELYRRMLEKQMKDGAPLLFLTIHKDDPTGLGRILRDEGGNLIKIVEEKLASDAEKKIREINTGFYCFNRQFLIEYLPRIQKNAVTGEYYLTDLVELALQSGLKVETIFIKDNSVWHGVNNRIELARAERKIK